MLENGSDYMETIRNNLGIREIFLDDCSVGRRKINADNPYSIPPFKFSEKMAQSLFRSAFSQLKYSVSSQITKGSNKTDPSGKIVFINPQHPGTRPAGEHALDVLQMIMEPTLYGCSPNLVVICNCCFDIPSR